VVGIRCHLRTSDGFIESSPTLIYFIFLQVKLVEVPEDCYDGEGIIGENKTIQDVCENTSKSCRQKIYNIKVIL
jgi:hypothetical protein